MVQANTAARFDADAGNGLANLIGLLVLSGVIVKETRAYFAQPNWRDVSDDVDPSEDQVGIVSRN